MQKINHKATLILMTISIISLGVCAGYIWKFETSYSNLVYPTISVGEVPFGGKTQQEVEAFWLAKNTTLADIQFEFRFDSHIATLAAETLGLSYDATLSATQALSVGRSKHFFSNIRQRYTKQSINLPPSLRWDTDAIDQFITSLSETINIPVENALFQFTNNKVIQFKPSRSGRIVNIKQLKEQFITRLHDAIQANKTNIVLFVPVDIIEPIITTKQTNSFGIKELIGRGYSEFPGSIPGRIHNVALAASRLNGVLIPPGSTFSFNDTVGDISAATGYQSAYIIKDGRTVLGDGGGVCQVSTTLFRAALNAGLPIVERSAHSYRVHYYEDDGSKAGLDATVFNPTEDLKFINNTPAYILIQTKIDLANVNLTFEFYGATDGRKAEILNHVVGGISAPPPPLYQDDPTLPVGVVKQVDFSAWGAKASFEYRVSRSGQVIFEKTFVSNYRPWQAVYLKGTKQ
ncbi:MAG: VanW family protein [Microgenomates group bacterium GW2011_GWC1_37_12b]|nr:MAG: VanW family protein [Microgenomates group bacterium GW2011_GWC1_37_12b]